MKFSVEKDDFIANPKTNAQQLIEITEHALKLKDYLIGVPLIISGIAFLIIRANRNGAKAYKYAELKTLEDLGLIS